MDLVRTIMLYMMMLVGTATGVSPSVTPIPANALPTPTPYVTQAPTAVPTARPTASPRPTRYTTLYVGDKGNAVRALQNRLKELGYLSGNADGSYGAQTKTAVENFQRANGLKVDGIAGRNTQQIMFESENVVYAHAATLIPTAVPITPTPIAPAIVTVRYLDAGNSALLHQTTVQCYADTNVYADATMVPATYRLVSNSYVSIRVSNGQASPSTVTFYYQRGATAAPSVGVDIPVYYLDSTNLIVARETRTLYQSGTIAADASLIPAGYTLSGSSVVYVTITGNTASPNPVLFRLNRNQVTPTPVPVSGVVVPVNYINAVTGQVFASQNVTLYRTGTVYPQRSLVPEGYTLISASYVTVTIANGRANPSSISFTYQPYQPTATPIVGATVPVNYIESSTNRVILSTTVSLATSQLVYADLSLVPGYTLTSASSVYVTVRNGQASPGSVTFRLMRSATPTPSSRQIAVPVRYLYGTRLIANQTVYLMTGTTSYVYADEAAYGSGYVINGSNTVRVIVSSEGVASPSIVTFYVTPRATATPRPTAVPVFQVTVPVRYMYGTRLIASTTVTLQNGTSTTVYADASVYGSQYVISGSNSVNVSVSQSGVASPSVVTFYLTPVATPTPTSVPIYQKPVPVQYMVGSQLIASYQEMCTTNSTTTVYADPSVYEGRYLIQGDNWVNVYVDAAGNANPATVIFYLIPVTTDPPAPSFEVPVNVEYRDGNQLVYSTVVMLSAGRQSEVQADPSVYAASYTLDGSGRVTVTVSSDGFANPNPVIFYLTPIVTPVTPVPVTPEPFIPPTPPAPSGDKNQELPSYKTGSFKKSYDVYQGPGTNYYRNGRAQYGGGGAARIFGYDGEWLLIGYETGKGDYRIGYIQNYTLPAKIDPNSLRPLTYAWISTTIAVESVVTDDPVINMKQIEKLAPGTPVNFLAWVDNGHRWALIEYVRSSGETIRAFVKGKNLACMQ